MKIRMKSPIGSAVSFPVADALGDATLRPDPSVSGSPVDVDAAALGLTGLRPNSRRVKASAVHASGAAAGASPLFPVCSHASRPRPRPDTAPEAAADRITGACAAAAWAADAITGSGGCTATTDAVLDFGCTATTSEPTALTDATAALGAIATDGGTASPGGATRLPAAGATTTAGGSCGTTEVAPLDGASVVPCRPRVTAAVSVPVTADPLCGGKTESEPPAGTSTAEPLSAGALGAGAPRCPPTLLPGTAPLCDEDDEDDEDGEDGEDDDDPSVPDPVEPPEPVRSAKASGIATAAEPTPRATANAPTRPTNRAEDHIPGSGTVVRRHSIPRRCRRPVRTERTAEIDGSMDMNAPLAAGGPVIGRPAGTLPSAMDEVVGPFVPTVDFR